MKEQLKVSVFELLMHVRQASSLCMAVLFTGNAVRVCVCVRLRASGTFANMNLELEVNLEVETLSLSLSLDILTCK